MLGRDQVHTEYPMIGFTRRQEEKLREIRAAYTIGDPRYCEPTPVHARLLFARWLVETGRLSEEIWRPWRDSNPRPAA